MVDSSGSSGPSNAEKTLTALGDADPDAVALLRRLQTLWGELERAYGLQWQRSLTLVDMLVDRWERARRLGFGEGASIYGSATVRGDVTVGPQTWIGPNAILDGSGGLSIGGFCSISSGVQIYTHDTVAWALSGGQAEAEHAPVRIGSRTYIGAGAMVLKGVSIGDGCVIGAMSLVRSDIPAGSEAVGIPARIVGPARPPRQ